MVAYNLCQLYYAAVLQAFPKHSVPGDHHVCMCSHLLVDCRVRNTTLGALSPLSTPPISYRCGIFYNLDYKILFLRNRKAASTSIKKAIINALPIGQAMMRLDPSALQSTGFKSFDAMWRDCTVISSVRNPWARAGGGWMLITMTWCQSITNLPCLQCVTAEQDLLHWTMACSL